MNWLRDYLPPKALVLDSSALINIFGCGASEQVFSSMRFPCLVEDKVLAEIVRHPVPGFSHVAAINALIQSGRIEPSRMDAREYETFVSMSQALLVKRLGAGESAALAVAFHRDLAIVLDDNKARTARAALFPKVEMISSLKLLLSASVRLGWSKGFLGEVIFAALRNSRMGVPRDEKALLNDVLDELG